MEFSICLARGILSLNEPLCPLSLAETGRRTKPRSTDRGCPLQTYCKVKQGKKSAAHFLPLEAFWSHNTGNVLKHLLPGIFWRPPCRYKVREEVETQRRRVDIVTERLPLRLHLLAPEYKHTQAEVGDKLTLLLLSDNKAHYIPPVRSWAHTHPALRGLLTAQWHFSSPGQDTHTQDPGLITVHTPDLFARSGNVTAQWETVPRQAWLLWAGAEGRGRKMAPR